MRELDRRQFLGVAAGATLALAACSSGSSNKSSNSKPKGTTKPAGLGDPTKAPFDHVIVLMMENRSFDHLLGWLPGTDGKQAGLTYLDTDGKPQQTWDLGTDYQGCNYAIPGHQWPEGAKQLNGGKGDGFLLTSNPGDLYAIGYYGRDALPITAVLAEGYTTFDNYFAAMNAGTWPNRMYMHAAATDVDVTGLWPGTAPGTPTGMSNIQMTIWDRLRAAGLTGGYYSYGEPVTGQFTSHKYDDISYKIDAFFTDASAGKLPNVTFVEPDFTAPTPTACPPQS